MSALRKEVVENWRTIVFSLLSVYGLLALLMVLGNLLEWSPGAASAGREIARYMVVYMVLSLSTVVVASLAFRGLKSKTGRVELFTCPSSMFEKFLVNAVIYVLGFVVAFFVCAQLADLTRIALLWPWSGGEGVPGPINFLITIRECAANIGVTVGDMHQSTCSSGLLWVDLFASCGLFLMGSVLWPRLSFLKTFTAQAIVGFVSVFVLMISIWLLSDIDRFVQWWFEVLTNGHVMMLLNAWVLVKLLLFWLLAWWLWKRKDVVSLKWWS